MVDPLGSEPLLPPAVDLHEDVSLYYIRTPRGLPLGDFREDVPGRHGDIPKYRRANVRVVFAAMATTIRGFSPYRASKLSEVCGSRNAWSPVAKYRAPLDLLWEHLVTYYKMSEVYGIRIVESAEEFEDCLRGAGGCASYYSSRALSRSRTPTTSCYSGSWGLGALAQRGTTPTSMRRAAALGRTWG